MQFCSRDNGFKAAVEDAPQLNLSPPQGRGGGTTVGFPEASVAELWGFALVVGEDAPFTEQHTHKQQIILFLNPTLCFK